MLKTLAGSELKDVADEDEDGQDMLRRIVENVIDRFDVGAYDGAEANRPEICDGPDMLLWLIEERVRHVLYEGQDASQTQKSF